MNIVNKLTLRHLKENKRRTLVTIIGVIISVAMVTAVATLSISFLDLLKRQTIATDGEWHVQYKNVNPNQIAAIEKDDATKELVLSNDLGYANLEGSENENKPYLFIKQYNEQGLKDFPIEISEGRLPEKENEIVISEEIADNANVEYEIGDQLTLEIGNRYLAGEERPLLQTDPLQRNKKDTTEDLQIESTETLTIVGTIERPTWEPAWSPGYTVVGYVDQHLLDKNKDTVDALVVLNKLNRSLYEHAEKNADQLNIEKVNFHDDLLRLYGLSDNNNLNKTMFWLTAIIMFVIIIGSVALIYNAFAISVSERSRHLGMLSSVGATKKQKRNSVFFEGIVIGAMSIPLGVLAGIGGIAATFAFINTFLEGALGVSEDLEVVVTAMSILASCIISIVTIFISTYLPARKASKVSAIDAIRQTQDVKLSRKAVKTSKLIRKVFGIEAEIGLKNLKRNKRRYQATVFSLVISIVLFLTVSYFTDNLKKSLELSQANINYDIQVLGNSGNRETLESLTKLKHVTESSFIERLDLNTWIDQSDITKKLQENVKKDKSILKDGKYPYSVVLHGLDEQNFAAYAKKVGADVEKLQNPEHPSAIVIDKISYQDYETGKFIEAKTIHTELGKVLDLYSMNYETGEEKFFNKVEIGALTEEVPMGVNTAGPGRIDVIVSEETMHQLANEKEEVEVQPYLYMNSSDPMATQEAIEDVKQSDMHVYNVYQRKQEEEQLIMLMSVFTYGFIVLISAISIANIFNTISTSISLRKREFAMLKSVGMTPKGFNKMINHESIFYGVKALVYGLPISIGIMYLIYMSLQSTFGYSFTLPWMSILYVIVAIFVIVSSAMLYSIKKVKKENIIDGLKQENI
jgi:putative ABC transport system permease protein